MAFKLGNNNVCFVEGIVYTVEIDTMRCETLFLFNTILNQQTCNHFI